MKKLMFFIVYLVLFGIQLTVEQPAWFKFDLVLLYVYAMAMVYGAQTGAAIGGAAGLVYDFLSGAVFGFHTLTRSAVGFVTGYIKEQVFKEHFACIRVLFFFVALFLTPLADGSFLYAYLQDTLAYCLGNMVFVIPVYKLCLLIAHWHRE